MFKTLKSCVALLLLAGSGLARAEPDTRPDTHAILVADRSVLVAGADIQLALQLRPKKGWHLYWKNYGDTGSQTSVDFTGWPAKTLISDWAYPTPQRLPFGALMNYGYKKPVTLLANISLPGNAPAGATTVVAKAQWLACTEEVCVPEKKDFTLTFSSSAKAVSAETKKLFADAQSALPQKSGWPADVHLAGGQFQVRVATGVALDTLAGVEFFPVAAPLIRHIAPQLVLKKDRTLWLETEADVKALPGDISGVLVLVDKSGTRQGHDLTFKVSATPLVPPADAALVGALPAASGQLGKPAFTFGTAFLFALFGGLLLNLMPCVFPILALKAFSLARAGESDSHARRDGLAYTAGVILTFTLIGGTLLMLRSGGAAIGWGFQLQDPRIVAALGLLMVLLALNLAGLFEFSGRFGNIGQGLAQRSGASGAFWTGTLAVLVATPCTAPFMAGALGAALVLPPVSGMGIFLGLGLGMALPFLLLGYLPGLRKLLPRPGAWMDSFKQFLAFPLLATALWLFWVVGQLTDVSGMAVAVGGALLLALGLWLWGRSRRWTQALGLIAVVAALAMPFVLTRVPTATAQTTTLQSAALPTEPYSDARLAELVGQGKPVFAYFTADWCISCKVNERVAIDRAEVVTAFRKAGVTVLVGDWTKRDDSLGKVLERHGRAGVPLYLYYGKGTALATPQVLPQVLTPDILMTTIAGKI
jgi:thiol:disulfide interchange protein